MFKVVSACVAKAYGPRSDGRPGMAYDADQARLPRYNRLAASEGPQEEKDLLTSRCAVDDCLLALVCLALELDLLLRSPAMCRLLSRRCWRGVWRDATSLQAQCRRWPVPVSVGLVTLMRTTACLKQEQLSHSIRALHAACWGWGRLRLVI